MSTFRCFVCLGLFLLLHPGRALALEPSESRESTAAQQVADSLLNLQLDFSGLKPYAADGVVTTTAESLMSTNRKVLVLNFWRTDCPPCLVEFPLLKEMFAVPLRGIDFALVSETLDLDLLRQFRATHSASMPQSPIYLNTDRRLRLQLRTNTLPITLVLDARRMVRHAVVGALNHQSGGSGKADLHRAIHRLLQAEDGKPRSLLEADVDVKACNARLATQLLHRRFDLNWLRAAGVTPVASLKRANVVFIRSEPSQCTSPEACQQELDQRLPGIFKRWKSEKDTALWLLTAARVHPLRDADLSRRELPLVASENPELNRLAEQCTQPLTLILDRTAVVRQVFIGPFTVETSVHLVRTLDRLLAKTE